MGGDLQRTTKETQRAREEGREGVQDTRKARIVGLDAAPGGAENRAVRSCHVESPGNCQCTKGVLLRAIAKESVRRAAAIGLPGGR